ncbi:MAG: hypothetical protein LQ352_000159 [Teloschistes flavicans]|nr:MAG: hypothetical protein LQ352_000159 [Teloschistes flavicans]
MPIKPDVTSGDESCDSNGKLVDVGTKRKSRSVLRPKCSKFSRKATDQRLNVPIVAGHTDEASAGSDDEVRSPERSLLATVTQEVVHQPRKAAEIRMIPYNIPSHQPQGPGDIWLCALENCKHRVHEASKAKGKVQVKEHLEEHASKAQEKIDLALSESRPYLPVRYACTLLGA